MPAEVLSTIVKEQQTAILSFELVDGNGDAIDGVQLTTVTLTYYDLISEAIINSRENQNIYNANDVTVVVVASPLSTTVTWTLQPEDTIIVDSRRETEEHIALFHWTWDSGNRSAAKEIQFTVENLLYVP